MRAAWTWRRAGGVGRKVMKFSEMAIAGNSMGEPRAIRGEALSALKVAIRLSGVSKLASMLAVAEPKPLPPL